MDGSVEELKKAKKRFLIVSVIAGVLIIGLIAAIVVVAVNKGKNSPEEAEASAEVFSDENPENGYILSDEELNTEYTAIASEIASSMIEMSENGEGFEPAMAMYLAEIETTEDVRLKAMLETDYYFLWFSMSPIEDNKNEILNNLMRIDGILKTPMSAYNVVNIASFYDEQEIVNYYTNLAMERGDAEDAGETADDEELETAP